MTEKWCKSPHPGTMIMVIDPSNEKVLMLRRKGEHGDGLWSVPGGWLDTGEEPEDSVLRELAEEVGDIRVKNLEVIAVTNDLHPEGKHSITFHYVATYVSGEPELLEPDKAHEVAWKDLEDIPMEDLFLPLRNLGYGHVSVSAAGFAQNDILLDLHPEGS